MPALTPSRPQHKPPYLPNRGNFTLFTLSQPGRIHSYHIKRLYCLSPSLSPHRLLRSLHLIANSLISEKYFLLVLEGIFPTWELHSCGATVLVRRMQELHPSYSTSIIFGVFLKVEHISTESQTFLFPSVPSEQKETFLLSNLIFFNAFMVCHS